MPFVLRIPNKIDMARSSITAASWHPWDIPIAFNDDGTYTGDGEGAFVAGGTAAGCSEAIHHQVKFRVSGNATETSEEQALHLNWNIRRR